MYPLIRQLLFKIDPEKSHHLSLNALATLEKLHLSCLLVAGLDKNAEYIDVLVPFQQFPDKMPLR